MGLASGRAPPFLLLLTLSVTAALPPSAPATLKADWLMCAPEQGLGNRSCSLEVERSLLATSSEEIRKIFNQQIRPFEEYYKQSYSAVIQNAKSAIQQAELEMQSLFSETYGSLYDENKLVFERLYVSLSWYVRSTEPLIRSQRFRQKADFSQWPVSSVRRVFRDFFAELTRRLVVLRAPQLHDRFGDQQVHCLISELNNENVTLSEPLQPLASLLSETLYEPLQRTLVAVRVWTNLLLAVARFLRDTADTLPVTEECVRAYGAVKICSRCWSLTPTQPCQQTCESVAQTCASLPTNFSTIWQHFFDVGQRFAQENDLNVLLVSLPELLHEFPVKLSHAIANATLVDFNHVLNDPVFQRCSEASGNDASESRVSDSWKEVNRNGGLTRPTSTEIPDEDAPFSDSLLNSTVSVFRFIEQELIAALCGNRGGESNCWNGVTLRSGRRPSVLLFDSAFDFPARQRQSLGNRSEFFDAFGLLLLQYTEQVRSKGQSGAGLVLQPRVDADDAEEDVGSGPDDEDAMDASGVDYDASGLQCDDCDDAGDYDDADSDDGSATLDDADYDSDSDSDSSTSVESVLPVTLVSSLRPKAGLAAFDEPLPPDQAPYRSCSSSVYLPSLSLLFLVHSARFLTMNR